MEFWVIGMVIALITIMIAIAWGVLKAGGYK